MTICTIWTSFMKNPFDSFDCWTLTDDRNINNQEMDTYSDFMTASKVGSHFFVSLVYYASKSE